MFKKKKCDKCSCKKETNVLVKPEPKVIRQLKNYRIVVKPYPIIKSGYLESEKDSVKEYTNQLVIEKLYKNTLNEPYYVEYETDRMSRKLSLSIYSHDRQKDLIFDILKELLLNETN